MSVSRNLLTGQETRFPDQSIDITLEEYTRLIRAEALLAVVLNASTYSRENVIAATKETLEKMQQEEQPTLDSTEEVADE